jgi:hypothetical protein
MIKYYKRIINGKVKELHLQEDKGKYCVGKTYPESEDSFNEEELIEVELDEWLDVGLEQGIF